MLYISIGTILEMSTEKLQILVRDAISQFKKEFTYEPTSVAFAPGRVNVIGEHTDYNDGFVMPIALELGTVVAGSLLKRSSSSSSSELSIKVITSADVEKEPLSFTVSYKLNNVGEENQFIKPVENPHWVNYTLGSIAAFSEYLVGTGESNELSIFISSTVPLGAGLSSSAAIEVATYYMMHGLVVDKTTVPDVSKAALACQKVEHNFAGVPCGIMDQMVSAGGRANSAMLIDCKTLTFKYVALPKPEEAVFVIADTGIRHKLAGSEYNVRRKQCEKACLELGVKSLRDIEKWPPSGMKIDDDTIMKRARHVVTENQRCLHASEIMAGGSTMEALVELGKLMVGSHNSLRDDYEVSCNELDNLVSVALDVEGVFGSRMTGGGFGGSTVTLVKPTSVTQLVKALETGGAVRTLVVSAADGARILFTDCAGLTA